jgi:hypothetical protein
MSDERRIQELERANVKLRSDFDNHVALCDARMRVMWKMGALLTATIALLVSTAVALATR